MNDQKKYGRFNTKRLVTTIICVVIIYSVAAYTYKLISDYIFIGKSNKIAEQIGEEKIITGIWYTEHPYKLKLIVQQNADRIYLKIYDQLSGNIPFSPQYKIDTILHDRKTNFEINKGFSIEKWGMHFRDGQLCVVIDQHFTDNSGRQDNIMKYTLKRKHSIF